MFPLLRLNRPTLIGLAAALETERLSAPFSVANLITYVPTALRSELAVEFNRLAAMGATSKAIAYTLRLIAAEREFSQEVRDRIELVWTGPEVVGTQSRDTKIVVQDLFSTAKTSILISSFAIERGKKARELFQVLSERMDANPKLKVRMFLNVSRPYRSEALESVLLREFAELFRQEIWTGRRFPEVFYDPRSLDGKAIARSCLHAKCVVVDEERVLITSANFTEAAHERNIEAGVLLLDRVAAKAIYSQFNLLVERNILRRISGI